MYRFLLSIGDKHLTRIIGPYKDTIYQSILSHIDYILSNNRDNLYLRGMGTDMYIPHKTNTQYLSFSFFFLSLSLSFFLSVSWGICDTLLLVLTICFLR